MSTTRGSGVLPNPAAQSTATIARYVWVLAALAVAAPLIAGPRVSSLTALVTAFVLAAAGLVIAATAGDRIPEKSGFRALIGLAIVTAIFAGAAVFAPAPRVSLWGTVGQHNGAALWLAATAFSLCFSLVSTPSILKRLLAVFAVASAVYALAAIAEEVVGTSVLRWGSSAGVLENSSSLGQFLVLGLACSVAWGMSERKSVPRIAATSAGLLAALGLVVSSSRAGMWGVLAAGLVAAASVPAARSKRGRRMLAAALPLAAVALTTAGVAVASNAPARGLGFDASRLLTDRDAIWRAAWHTFSTSPFAPRGLDQFSAWVVWSIDQGVLRYNATYDAHNWVLSAAIAGGVVGLVLLLIVLGTCTHAALTAIERSRGSWPIVIAFGGIVGVAASALLTWFTPVAVVGSAALFGALLGATGGSAEKELGGVPRVPRALLYAAAILCLVTPLVFLTGITAEYRTVSGLSALQAEEAVGLYDRWPDPAFAAHALYTASASQGGMDAEIGSLMTRERFGAATTYHVDAALAGVFAEQAAAQDGEQGWDRFSKLIQAGRMADGASGIWDVIAAVEADKRGLGAESRMHAKRALTYPLSAEAQALMQDLAGKRD